MPRARPRLLACLALALVLAALLLAVSARADGPAPIANASGAFSDAVGDGQGAPDLGTVSYAVDGTSLTVTAALADRPAGLLNGDVVALLVDSDQDGRTGCRGYEWMLSVHDAATTARFSRCQDGRFVDVALADGYASAASGTVSFSLSLAALGQPPGLSFSLTSLSASGADVAPDLAPYPLELVPGAQPAPDRTPPKALALPAAGRHGALIQLRFQISDDSGQAGVFVAVYHGHSAKPSVAKSFPVTPLGSSLYQVSYRSSTPLAGHFCVQAVDGAGNKSRRSCAALVVR